jgi:DNA-binding MarR family transcriptional regulator
MNTNPEREEQLVLELLDAVGRRSDVSQRHLARHMGVALGLANSYLRRCIRKGFIKITDAPANRYLYYLTPKGFAEKSRLTAKYFANSLAFYRRAGESCQRIFDVCEARGWRRLMLCGMSDLAEIASLRALERDVEVAGIYDPHTDRHRCVGKPVWRRLEQATPCDAWLLTDLNAPLLMYRHLTDRLDSQRLLIPDILRLE